MPLDEKLIYDIHNTPIGKLYLFMDSGNNILQLSAEKELLIPGNFEITRDKGGCDFVKSQLDRYFEKKLRDFNLQVRYRGTDFQNAVWDALTHIPYGETATYQDIAMRIGKANASRAVGTAIGSNPVLIIVPCHRVIRTSGELGGFRCGLEAKKKLLDLEQSAGI